MASSYGRVGALRPADLNEAELYICPASTQFVGTLHICNQDTKGNKFSVAMTDASGAATGEDWLYYETDIAENEGFPVVNVSLAVGQTIRVQASVADKLSFILHGLEKS